MTKALFLDRDGVINRRIKGGYVRNWSEFVLLSHVGEVVKAAKERGYLAIIITNQRGIGKGLMTEADLHAIHAELQQTLGREHDVAFDDIYYCGDLRYDSPRRKPSPMMLLEAAQKWDIDLANSWMVGDSVSDVLAGKAAGTKTAFILTEHSTELPENTLLLHSLEEVIALL